MRINKFHHCLMIAIGLVFCSCNVNSQENTKKDIASKISINDFRIMIEEPLRDGIKALKRIENQWQDGYAAPLVEIAYISRDRRLSGSIIKTLDEQTGQSLGYDLNDWYQWLWKTKPTLPSYYADLKSLLHGKIDPKFGGYFNSKETSKINLTEVRWGGVVQDGIPPLRKPKMISAKEADYLEDSNIIFGLEVNGDARAYPKRILAWHEMFVDTVGNESVTGVYCTLCGSMILYSNYINGKEYQLGTSGFLYRSNKLMFDQKTQSLWNTLTANLSLAILQMKI